MSAPIYKRTMNAITIVATIAATSHLSYFIGISFLGWVNNSVGCPFSLPPVMQDTKPFRPVRPVAAFHQAPQRRANWSVHRSPRLLAANMGKAESSNMFWAVASRIDAIAGKASPVPLIMRLAETFGLVRLVAVSNPASFHSWAPSALWASRSASAVFCGSRSSI